MKQFLPISLLLLMAGLATAAPVVRTDVYEFGAIEGAIVDPGKFGFDNVVDWTHTMPYTGDSSNIIGATLTIEGEGIDNIFSIALDELDFDGPLEDLDLVSVSFKGTPLGNMTGNSTTFDIPIGLLSDPLTAMAEIEFQFDPSLADLLIPHDTARLTRSTLTITAVPAPGAVLLCGIGTMMTGWLKRRRSL